MSYIRSPKIERHFWHADHGHLHALCQLKIELLMTDAGVVFIQLIELPDDGLAHNAQIPE